MENRSSIFNYQLGATQDWSTSNQGITFYTGEVLPQQATPARDTQPITKKRFRGLHNKEINIDKLFDIFISQQKNLKSLRPETLRGYRYVFETFRKLMPEATTVDDINSTNLLIFFEILQKRERLVGNQMKNTGVKESTIHTYRQKLKLFFDWLVGREDLNDNPFAKMVKASRPEYTDSRALKKEDLQKILMAIVNNPQSNAVGQSRDLFIFYVLLFCGLRSSEMRLLDVMDVDLDEKILTVRKETSKSKKTKTLPINPTLFIYLKKYLEERRVAGYTTSRLIVSSLGDKGLSAGGLKHLTERWKRLSGVNFHLHRFRHTFATNLSRQNTNMSKIQKLMGHSDIKMTSGYTRSLDIEDLRGDVDNLNLDGMS